MKIGDEVWFFRVDGYKRGSSPCKRLDSGVIIGKRNGVFLIRASRKWLIKRKAGEIAVKEKV